jgi:hypothetical protein
MRDAIGILAVLFVFAGPACAAEPPEVFATGDWSKPVADKVGYALRGRLILCRKRVSDERRDTIVYVELQDASDFVGHGMQLFCDFGKTDLRPEYKPGLKCEMRDKDKKLIEPTGYPFGGGIPKSEWVGLPVDATIRLRATPFGINRPKALAISPELNKLWVINDGDPKEYFLSGTFTIDPKGQELSKDRAHVWRGTIDLPAMKIVNKGK